MLWNFLQQNDGYDISGGDNRDYDIDIDDDCDNDNDDKFW